MPSLSSIRDYILPVAAAGLGGLLNRQAAGSAVNNLRQGANTAMGTIQGGADQARNDIQAGAAGATRTLADVFDEQKRLLDPFRQSGAGALDTLAQGTAAGGEFNRPITMADFELYKDPGFQWRVEQGERAIKAGANAGGIRFSGATLKALSNYNQEAASQEASAAYGRYQGDTTGRFNRLSSVADRSFDAANQAVNAGGTYGSNLANLQTGTGRSLADLQTGTSRSLAELQTDLASAEAMGDVAKASSLTNMINSILSGVENVGTAKTLASLIPKAAGTAGTAAALGGGFGAAGPTGVGTTSIIGSTTGGGGALGAMGAFLTNPITIAAGAALGIGLLWRKSQAHHEANEWVQGTQNDFDKNMAAINEDPQLTPENKAELQRANVIDYLAAALDFMQKGSDQREVIQNAMRTFRRWYPQYASMAVA